jgi:AbiV family abortive infection protein
MKQAYKDCFKNADKYLEESIVLKKSDPSHALALAIMGQEEVGKAMLVFCIGILEELGEAPLAKEWWQQIYKHEPKLALALMSSFAQSLTTVEMRRVMEKMPNLIAKAKSSRDPIRVVSQYISKIYPSINQQISSEAEKKLDSANELQELKERGFYVDTVPDGSSVSTPFEISNADAEEQIKN